MMRDVATELPNLHASFALVYITEAHAQNEWPVGDPLLILQPVSNAERLGIARQFARDYQLPPNLPVLVDTIDNLFCVQYSAWPIRFFVLEHGGDSQFGIVPPEPSVAFVALPDGKNTYDSSIVQLKRFLLERYSTSRAT